MKQKEIILILGMHRSGTSLLTGALDFLGVSAGANLMQPTDDNAKGYFENLDIVQLNEKILSGLGYTWDSITFNEPALIKRIPYTRYIEAKEIIEDLLLESHQIVIKDPRNSLLLLFWDTVIRELLKIKLKVVWVVRSPYETAKSEMKRAAAGKPYHVLGSKFDYNLRLWFVYNVEIINQLNQEVYLISFSELIDNPSQVLSELTEFLDHPTESMMISDCVNQFFDTSLRHQNASSYQSHLDKSHNHFIWNLYEHLVENVGLVDTDKLDHFRLKVDWYNQVKEFNFPIKEFPMIVKRYLTS